ncbi:MAG: hypothetical protein H0U62_01390 [Actinobacteria bacterium]|nr:hypothetical protein [Actinomycetota bacterium]
MAISYSLDLATPSPTAQVASELHDIARAIGLFDASVTPERVLDEGVATVLGTWIRVVEAKPRPWNAVVTDLGFTPTVWITFRLSKRDELDHQQDDMNRLVSGLLDRVPGDAVLHLDYEHIWLLRRGGDLSLNERDDLWTPNRLAALSQRYRRATHTFSEE